MEELQELFSARDMDDFHRAIDSLNLTAKWALSKASDDHLEKVTDALLLAMHDLRSVLLRKKRIALWAKTSPPVGVPRSHCLRDHEKTPDAIPWQKPFRNLSTAHASHPKASETPRYHQSEMLYAHGQRD